MREMGTITEEARLQLLEIVNSRAWRHVTEIGDFYCQAPDQVGDFLGRVVKLKPDGWLHPHTDAGPPKRHIVLQTNDKVRCYYGGQGYYFEQGHIYEVDVSQEHSSTNHGDTDRIHLICS